jgi:hypothetical protein
VIKLLPLLLLLLCLSCSSRPDLAGRYEASHTGPSGPVNAVMTLAEDGSGKWEIGGEVLPFSWVVREGALNVHTRDGAVVEGVIEGGNVRLDVPGVGTLDFVRGK